MKPNTTREILERSKGVIEQAFSAQNSSPLVTSLSQDEYKQNTAYQTMQYGYAPTQYAETLIAFCDDAICHLSFVQCNKEDNLSELKQCWANTDFTLNNEKASVFAKTIFAHQKTPNLLIKGTQLQRDIWQALLYIPQGALCTYQDIANQVGRPKAVRAVASAIGANEISYLIPCHRVVGKSGTMNGYRWGIEIKENLLREETNNFAMQYNK